MSNPPAYCRPQPPLPTQVPALQFHLHRDPNRNQVLARLAGALTLPDYRNFYSIFTRGPDNGCRYVLDLRDLGDLDSAALGMLLIARERVAARGGRLCVRVGPGKVQDILRVTQLDELFCNED
jgi:anti-anti-sigma factor